MPGNVQKKIKQVNETCHPDHTKDVIRLNRIEGQLGGIRKMIEEQRYCPEILMQTRAVKAAIKSLEASILEKHLEHCVLKAFSAKNKKAREEKIKELTELFRKNT
ncbi:MAG TPA: metal-sensitive transcriptional regulator [Oligoflexia bacterium]|nr:metal-sensitive transcriptional regulator [bacterium]HMQ11359.1 metal-sensitive transcriptional regulator [Oligoflexia bacterium]HMR24075.1 metal-sensitive transcriptional regulator [Oligoflexia bacterium]